MLKPYKFFSLIHLVLLLFLWSGISESACAQDVEITSKYTITNRQLFSKKELKKVWKKMAIPQIMIPIRNAVDVIEITYTSKWHDGSLVKASGLVFLPIGIKKPSPELIYLHGTKIEKLRRINLLHGEQSICAGFAADGYIVAMPDYLGIGQGERFHLYQHAETQSQASVDMLRAIRQLLIDEKVQSDNRLFVTGYSQGGHAAMGLHRDIQQNFSTEFNVVASSPMSGPYDLSGVQSESLFEPYEFPSYLPYLLKAYHDVYKLTNDDFHTLFKSPYDSIILHYYTGAYAIWDINPHLPMLVTEMLKDELVAQFKRDSNFSLRKALKANDVYDWSPQAPMQICYCLNDEQVTYKNALVAAEKMKANGSTYIKLRRSGKNFNHIQCAVFANIQTKLYFNTIRNGSKNGRKGNIIKRSMLGLSKALAPGYYKRKYSKEKMPEFMSP